MDYLIIKVEKNHVTAVRFRFSGRSASLGGSASFVCDEETPLSVIAQRIAEGGAGSPRVVLCLAPALFAQRIVELPLTDLRKVREVLPAHLQGEMVLPSEDVVFDAIPTTDGKFLALWSKKAEITHFIDIFKTAGIEPQIVTSEPFSWSLLPGIPTDSVVCDGNAFAVMKEGRLSFMSVLSEGDKEAQIAATLSALELSGMMLPAKLIIFGEHADALEIPGNFTLAVEFLELPTELAVLFRTDAAFKQLVGMYSVARNCNSGLLPDFRRGDLAWKTGGVKQRKALIRTAILATIVIILLFVSKGMQYRAVRSDIMSLDRSIFTLYREIFPSRTKAVDELAEIRGEIRKLAGVGTSGGVLDILRKLAEAKGTTINGLYEADLDGRTLRLKGDARSAQGVSDFKAALVPVMASVELGEVKSRPDGTVRFSLSGMISEGTK
jgi:general secretion pathway protein L